MDLTTPNRNDKTVATKEAIKSVLGLADDQKAKMKSVKIKIKFDTDSKVKAIKRRANSMGSRLSDKAGVTR